MIIYHYDMYYKFYICSEEKVGIVEEDARKGIGIPAGSTIVPPPIDQCRDNEIPVFENNSWIIVQDDFWRPEYEEINYDSGRSVDTFQFIEFNWNDLMKYKSMPQICNTSLVGMRIYQSIIIINKKFAQCIEMHRMVLENRINNVVYSPVKGAMTFCPSVSYELKTDLESIVFIMRRVLDSLVQLTDLMVNFSLFERTKCLSHESVGSLFSENPRCQTVKSIVTGGDIYEYDNTGFIKVINSLFNGYKHCIMNDETFRLINSDYITITGYSVKKSNYDKLIYFHNHNAYHFMMGFQDCVARVLRNQELYRLNSH